MCMIITNYSTQLFWQDRYSPKVITKRKNHQESNHSKSKCNFTNDLSFEQESIIHVQTLNDTTSIQISEEKSFTKKETETEKYENIMTA